MVKYSYVDTYITMRSYNLIRYAMEGEVCLAKRKTKFEKVLDLCSEAEGSRTVSEMDSCISEMVYVLSKGTKYEEDIKRVLDKRYEEIMRLKRYKIHALNTRENKRRKI